VLALCEHAYRLTRTAPREFERSLSLLPEMMEVTGALWNPDFDSERLLKLVEIRARLLSAADRSPS